MITLDELTDAAPKLSHDAYLETLNTGGVATIKNENGDYVEHKLVDGKIVETKLEWDDE